MMRPCLLALLGLLALGGCSEVDQTLSQSTSKADAPAFQGGASRYMVKGWTPGDKSSWESQLRTRSLTQNEYNRIK
ncbi:MAG: hypothetical protein ACI83P_001957 [Janthinobacterium sp.]|jgi:hypothetical protein